jgi:hypothetical protein
MPLVDELTTAMVVELKNVLGPMVARVKTLEATVARQADTELLVTREVSPLKERIAALEARPPAPGPPGADGAPGRDGAPGPKGDPGLVYRGVYQEATAYSQGDVVTWAGGAWHCNEATIEKPGEGSRVWTLMVKRGRDAKGAR